MAATLKLISLLFLISFLSYLRAQARDSQFFNKEVYNTTPKETQPSELDPNTTNQKETNNGYYTDQGYPTEEFDNNVEFTAEKFPTGEDETVDTTDRLSTRGNNDQQRSTAGFPGKGWKEQYGMSDTRYLDNGRYSYDIEEDGKVPSGPDAYENYDPLEDQEDEFVP